MNGFSFPILTREPQNYLSMDSRTRFRLVYWMSIVEMAGRKVISWFVVSIHTNLRQGCVQNGWESLGQPFCWCEENAFEEDQLNMAEAFLLSHRGRLAEYVECEVHWIGNVRVSAWSRSRVKHAKIRRDEQARAGGYNRVGEMNCVCDVRVQLSVMRGKDIHGISRRMSELNGRVDRMGCCVVRDCCGRWRILDQRRW